MSASASLIPELEQVLQQGSRGKCAEMLSGITHLFLGGASRFNEEHVALFDDIFARLIDDIEARALVHLSARLAPVENAPPNLVLRLAQNDDIAIAAPMLEHSARLIDTDLREIAGAKGQEHLLAIAGRQRISETVTDVLVQRGNHAVVMNVADNTGARLSERGFSTLVDRAAGDGELAEKVGQRSDISPRLFRTLLIQATEVVQQRLLANARPEIAAEIRRVLAKVSDEVGARAPAARDYSCAKAVVLALKEQGELDEPSLTGLARSNRFEETVVALAELTAVPIETVERLMAGEHPDPVLILCKAAGFGWPTVRALIVVRPSGKGTSTQTLDAAYAHFERLSALTAQRVVRFWQMQPEHAA